MAKTFDGLKDFYERFSPLYGEVVDEARYQMLKQGHEFAFKEAKAMSEKAQDTGEMAGAWVQEPPSRKGASKAVSSFKNRAAHANVIDEGRFRSVPGVKKVRQVRQGRAKAAAGGSDSRMYGSPELPRGISRPVSEKVKAKANSFATTAIAKAEAKLK
jgi:hypothetical protein